MLEPRAPEFLKFGALGAPEFLKFGALGAPKLAGAIFTWHRMYKWSALTRCTIVCDICCQHWRCWYCTSAICRFEGQGNISYLKTNAEKPTFHAATICNAKREVIQFESNRTKCVALIFSGTKFRRFGPIRHTHAVDLCANNNIIYFGKKVALLV